MLTCKQVSKALSREDYAKLSFWKKLGLKMHVSLCFVCGRFNRQVMVMQDTCRHYKKYEDEIVENRASLDDERKRKMREALEREAS